MLSILIPVSEYFNFFNSASISSRNYKAVIPLFVVGISFGNYDYKGTEIFSSKIIYAYVHVK